jgi:glycosyltransferase involved in cell wall biosynthesis
MRILILNWRDPRSPRGGGAELLTHEVAQRLVVRGHEVTWFSSRPDGLPAEETVDGVRIVRRGSELTTRWFAPAFARRLQPDLIVDEVNTIPYFAPQWSRVPVLFWINQLAREVWWHEAPKPLAALGYASEPLYLQAYRSTPTVTISESTRDDLLRLGSHARIDVMPMAVNTEPLAELPSKRLEGHLLAIGRLAPSKRYDHAIRALAELRRTHPAATLTIIGDGPERERLESLARELGIADAVALTGRVDEAEKTRLLTDSDVLVGTSAREGWGLTVTEAAVRGTPAVVYDVPGFRDSVVDGRTGLLAGETPRSLVHAIRPILDDRVLYDRLRAGARRQARMLDWDRTADAFEAAVRAAKRTAEDRLS